MKMFGLAIILILTTSCSSLIKKDITYNEKDIPLKGLLVTSKKFKGKRPGVLVVHEWWGHNKHSRRSAKRLAKLGYVALAVDMYGNGKTASHPKEAGDFSGELKKNLPEAKKRFMAAYDVLKNNPEVDPTKISAIGYCFGGGIVLQMAREGVDLKGVVSFHGTLDTDKRAKKGKIKSKILVLNGADDKFISKESISNFEKEMKKAKADYKFINYEGAIHSFTNPQADEFGKKFNIPVGYNKNADEKSWEEMKSFLTEVFK